MYAVIRTGGKQYRAAAGDSVEVEKLDGEVGETITLNDVLLVADGDTVQIGQPTVAGASVSARITGQHRDNKVRGSATGRRNAFARSGHRQYLTCLQIESVNL